MTGRRYKAGAHGAGTWVRERLSSLLLVPLSIWALASAACLAGGGYEAAAAWLARPANAAGFGALALISLWHMRMGAQVVIEDYIHRKGTHDMLSVLNSLICLVLAAATALALAKLALGLDFGV